VQFDWRAGWGTEEFEDALHDGQFHTHFPPVWAEADDRIDAREIVDANLKKLKYKKDLRRQVLENGSKLDGPFFDETPTLGEPLKFRYCLTNTNPGHNMPSGSLGAQPQMWMNVVLISPSGRRVWETGYVDSNGDLADNFSLDVLARRVPLDTQLFNLQTKFLTTNVKGTDREMYLPVNFDIDQLPFLRPPSQPVTVINHPPGIRMEAHSLPPLGSRNAKFVVPSRLMQEPGVYRMSIRMRSRAEPIYFMRFVEATPEMERMMNEWIADFHVHRGHARSLGNHLWSAVRAKRLTKVPNQPVRPSNGRPTPSRMTSFHRARKSQPCSTTLRHHPAPTWTLRPRPQH